MAAMDPSTQLMEETGHSVVTKALRDGVPVVVKRSLHKEDPKTRIKWQREVRMLQLVQDRIDIFPQFLDCDADALSINLAFKEGVALDKCLNGTDHRCSLSRESSLTLWAQMAGGLDFLHSRSLMHDDVRPENIIWNQKAQQCALVDFGAAHKIDPAAAFDLSGTPCYVAPEYLRRERSEKFDIWALAITMAFALGYLRLPDREWFLPGVFENEEDLGKMKDWIKEMLALREDVSTEIPLLAEMLCEDPKDRITAAQLCSKLN